MTTDQTGIAGDDDTDYGVEPCPEGVDRRLWAVLMDYRVELASAIAICHPSDKRRLIELAEMDRRLEDVLADLEAERWKP